MTLTMFDSVDLNQIPADARALAAYVDGRFANSAEASDRFPHAHLLTIAVFAEHDAQALDIETGDATPDQAAAWFLRQKARGVTRPCLYASASVMEREVVPAITAAGIPRSEVRLWSAHYTGHAHICGPRSCGAMSIEADATQWTDRAMGRNLDESLLDDGFFGTTPPPPVPVPAWQEAIMNVLPVLKQGDADKAGHIFFVHRLQALARVYGDINDLPEAACVRVDGSFGTATTAAVRAVQADNGLTQDGVVGPLTWGVLICGSAR